MRTLRLEWCEAVCKALSEVRGEVGRGMDTGLAPIAGKVSGDCQAQDWSSSGRVRLRG